MAKKRSKKNLLNQKVLGTDVKTLGAAIASAVIAEIAQAKVKKAFGSNTDSTQKDDRTDRTHPSTKEFASAMKSAVGETNPVVREAIATVADSLSSINPTIAAVVDAVRDLPSATTEAAEDAANTTKETTKGITADTKHSIGDTVEYSASKFRNVAGDAKQSLANAADAATAVLTEVRPDYKKSKQGKKGKKNKKNKKNKKK